jgi:mRNA interferase RelE/StbE
MFKFVLKPRAARSLDKLPHFVREQILKKLQFYSQQEKPLQFAERLKDAEIGTGRFRVGDYRVVFDVEKNKIIILKIGHRKDIYR